MIQKLSVAAIIENIESGIVFDAVAEDYSFSIKIASYVPYVCAAVHDGNQFRKELWSNCLHSAYDRWYEEDPSTRAMINAHPIVIAGMDSRFEYDLNRAPEGAIYDDAWGKKLWREPLKEEMKIKSLAKHEAFYKMVHALVKKLESLHAHCVVYDMHSYNWRRWPREVPTWNLGTQNVNNKRYMPIIEAWRQSLAHMRLPAGIKSTAAINDTFNGNGYFLKFITSHFKNTLVLATELAKVYCDEYQQILYPEVIDVITEELKIRIPDHARAFALFCSKKMI